MGFRSLLQLHRIQNETESFGFSICASLGFGALNYFIGSGYSIQDIVPKMSVAITIQLSPSALATKEKWDRASQSFPQAIKRGMDRSLAIVSGRIQERRLSGKGPFPVEQHRLGERTGQLKLRTRSTPAEITSTGTNVEVTGAIGSSVFYAAFQEFGTKTLPERAPFRTGINENIKYISDEISTEVIESLK